MSLPVRPYESIVIMNADASLETQKELFRKNKSIIESFQGSMNSVDTWGKRQLGNIIRKKKSAIYFHSTFTANSEAVAELERTMRINDDVLRFMHVRLDDGADLASHLEEFKQTLVLAQSKEKEREAKSARRQARITDKKK